MTDLNPDKLRVVYKGSVAETTLDLPRRYTLTHSDSTGDLFLTIGSDYDNEQISSLYTRFMRDEVLAEWQKTESGYELHLYMHISGGFCFGWASMRDRIFCYHLPLVLETIKYGDRRLYEKMPELERSHILVHFNSTNKKYDRVENYGQIKDISC